MILWIDEEKAFAEIQHLMIKSWRKQGWKEHMIKAIYNKPIVKDFLNNE